MHEGHVDILGHAAGMKTEETTEHALQITPRASDSERH